MIRAFAISLALALAWASWAEWRLANTRAAWATERAEQAAATAAALSQAAINLGAMQAQADMEAAAYEQERKASDDRADAADRALERLRKNLLSSSGSAADTGPSCGCDGSASQRTALGNCAAEYRRMAGIAERYRAQLVTLQAWAKAVRR